MFTLSSSSISCGSAGECAAVGSYTDSSSHQQGLLLTESSGTWANGIQATLPAGASSTNPNVSLNSVSCPSAGNCTAVGNYTDSSNNIQGLLLTETSGTWSGVTKAPLPANAATTSGFAAVYSVSCPSAGNCSAVGTYDDSSGRQGLLLTETGGAWTSAEASLPAGPTGAVLNSLSCPSLGNCSAVGIAITNGGSGVEINSLLMTESSGSWSAVQGTMPANYPASGGQLVLPSLSCSSAGNCSAVGSYVDSSGSIQGLRFTESSGAWAPGVAPAPPPGAGTNPVMFPTSVSCPSDGECSVVGHYNDSSSHQQGLLLGESSGTWGNGTQATPPANAAANPSVTFPTAMCTQPGAPCTGVSCPLLGSCAAVGSYTDSSSHQQGLLLTQSSGTWANGVEATPPAGASTTNPNVNLNSVSCASRGNCAALGTYTDGSNHTQALLIDARASSPGFSLSAPGGGTQGSPIASSSTSAALTGGLAPTGTITFKVFGPQPSAPTSCASGGTTVGSATVSGSATYNPSAGFTPTSGGDYWWYASYSGDASDSPVASPCGNAMPLTVVTPPPPSNTIAPATSGAAQRDQTLTLTPGQWTNSPSSITDQWEDCDSSGANCTPIAGQTSVTYTLRPSDVGHTIRVAETATNAGGSATTSSSPTGVVSVPPAPANLTLPTISGIARQGQTVSLTQGTWSGHLSLVTHQWEDCDSSGANCTPIPGQTGTTTTLRGADVGHTIKVMETATNAAGSDSAGSTPFGAVIGARIRPLVGLPRVAGAAITEAVGCPARAQSSCTVRLILTTLTIADPTHPRTVVVGLKTVTVRPGHLKLVQLSLNGAGRRLLRKHHHLKTRLTVSRAGQTMAAWQLKFQAPKRRRRG